MDRARLMAELRKLDSLPTLASIAAKVIDAMLSEESTPEELAKLIEADQALTLKVLRVANSAFYRRSRQVSQVKDAVLLMGLNAIKSLVLSISVYEAFDKVESGGGIDRRQFWAHSLAAALCAKLIAARACLEQADDAFVAGLLHDVGKIVMGHFSPGDYARVIAEARNRGLALLEAEREVFGYDHAEAGKWVLERWQLPEKLVKAVWFHHQGQFGASGEEVFEELACVVGLGDAVANQLGHGFDLSINLPGASAWALKKLGLSRADLEAIERELKESLPAMAGCFGVEIPSREEYIRRLQRANLELGRLSLELEQVNGELSWKLSERAARCVLKLDKRKSLLVEASPGKGEKIRKASRLVEAEPADRPGVVGPLEGEERWAGVDIVSNGGERMGSLLVLAGGEGGLGGAQLSESLSALAKIGAVALDNARLQMQLRDRAEKLARAHQRIGMAFEEVSAVQEKMAEIEKLKAFGELAGGLAHNFNNLLGTILGRVQLMMRQCSDEDICSHLHLIEKCALDGAQMVKRIQQFGKRDSAERLATVDVNEIVMDTLAMTENRWKGPSAAQGKISLDTALGEVAPVRANRAELREVFTNIILNAVDAMPDGGKIGVATGSNGANVFVKISDTGLGMTKEIMEKVFRPFFTTKGSQGAGLGLSVSYSIIARHKGKISVQSQQGKGSVFTVTLPAAIKTGEQEEKVGLKHQGSPKANILVIDDEKGMREVLCDILAASGHNVDLAEDGPKGLAIFKESKNDLVITDLAMMGMSGLEVAKAVKEISPKAKVLLLTGWGVQLDDEKVAQSGVNLVISKPFTLLDLNRAVSQLLQTPPKAT